MYLCKCGKSYEKQSSLNSHARFCSLYEKKTKGTIYLKDDKKFHCECSREFEKAQSLNAHFTFCVIHRKATGNETPIRLGRSSFKYMSSESRKKQGNVLSEKIKSGEITPSFKDKHHSEETKIVMSRRRTEFLENNPNSNIPWIEVSNGNRKIKVQGKWEETVAIWLNNQNIDWERKKIKFGNRIYTPDFFLNETTVIEVKGWMRERDLFKMKLFLEYNSHISILLIEKEEFLKLDDLNISDLIDLKEKYNLDNLDVSKFKSYK